MSISTYKTSKGGIRYKAVVWRNNQPICSKSFKRKIDARGWLNLTSMRQTDGELNRPKGNKISLAHFFHTVYLPNLTIRAGSVQDYKRIFHNLVTPKFGNRVLSEIDGEEWSNFLHGLVRDGMSQARANRVHTALSAVYRCAMKRKYVRLNPLSEVEWFREKIQPIEHWSSLEVKRFLNWAHENCPSRFALYLTAFETGMRVSELIALQKDCVDFEKGLVQVRRAWCKITKTVQTTTKNNYSRTLGMTPLLKSVLQVEAAKSPGPFVFSNVDGTNLTYDSIRTQMRTHQKKASVKLIGVHGFRHTFASEYLTNRGTLPELQRLMGHADYSTTLRYAVLAPEHIVSRAGIVSFELATPNKVVPIRQNEGTLSASEDRPAHIPTMKPHLSR